MTSTSYVLAGSGIDEFLKPSDSMANSTWWTHLGPSQRQVAAFSITSESLPLLSLDELVR